MAVVEPDAPPRELERLRDAGVRGIRLNFLTLGERYAGDAVHWLEVFEKIALSAGLHPQLFLRPEILVKFEHFVQNGFDPWATS